MNFILKLLFVFLIIFSYLFFTFKRNESTSSPDSDNKPSKKDIL